MRLFGGGSKPDEAGRFAVTLSDDEWRQKLTPAATPGTS
jgi:hypothetical protein